MYRRASTISPKYSTRTHQNCHKKQDAKKPNNPFNHFKIFYFYTVTGS